MSRHCYVVNCSRGDYQLHRKWKGVKCDKHGVFHADPPCDCDPPFRLFAFPGKVRAPEARQMWLKAINRADPKKPDTLLEPTRNQVVCSVHFLDGYPSEQHPYPELHLWADRTKTTKNQKLRLIEKEKPKDEDYVDIDITEETVGTIQMTEETVGTTEMTEEMVIPTQMSKIGLKFIIVMLLAVIKRLRKENSEIKKENVDLIGKRHAMKTRTNFQMNHSTNKHLPVDHYSLVTTNSTMHN